ncbi:MULTISPECIES: DUF3570 domain-containing protein [Colwellia]|uniref:DUF3570 domain-containing protein n=1 Tax=Colwellia marinimaniae TaxID=1513592 RepID=A0ABQ0MXJ8_9GAMM|nr:MULTISPECIES: DUF3570 domain-containing protein [Colwellia]GAW97097.1 hypothetical protein MTCD1_02723 [Colwellia marinimaniae]
MKKNNTKLSLLIVSSVVSAVIPLTSVAENKVAIQMQTYQENDDRIKVQDGKMSIEHDFGLDHTLNVEFDWDSISGASPTWDTVSGASQTATSDASTGASSCIDEEGNYYTLCRDTRAIAGIIGDGSSNLDDFSYSNVELEDHRNSAALLYTYRTRKMRNEISVGVSYSKESDFINTGISAEYMMYTDTSKNRAITVGVSYMANEVYDYAIDKWHDFSLINYQVGITQVFNSHMVGKFNVFYMAEEGHLSNPYFNVVRRINVTQGELVTLGSPVNFKYYLARESRPEQRKAGGISAQTVSQLNDYTQWHISYRFYQDSWDVDSHTIESKSYHRVTDKIRLSPALRYYRQGAANFFKAHDATDYVFDETGYASADHRLGNFDSLTVQFAVEYLPTDKLTWNIVTGYQQQSSGLTFAWVNFGAQYHY